jgi:hypothetical protein
MITGQPVSNTSTLPWWELEVLLPTQLSTKGMSPDLLLRLDVVQSAMDDLKSYVNARPGTAAHERYCRAYVWLMGHGRPLDFEEMCEVFGWSAEAIRERIHRQYPATPTGCG